MKPHWGDILRSRAFWPSAAGLAIVLLAFQMTISSSGLLSEVRLRLEWMAYDVRMGLTLPSDPQPDPRVVIVDIDERSLQQEGHWPWPRHKIAAMTDNLFAAGAAVIGYDIVFPEQAPNPARQVLEALNQDKIGDNETLATLARLSPEMDGDARLAESAAGLPVILGFVFEYRDGKPSGTLPYPPIAVITPEMADKVQIPAFPTYTGNIPQLQGPIGLAGFFNTDPDEDGVVRRSPMIARYGEAVYPALALEMVHQYFGSPGVEFITAEQGDRLLIEGLRFPQLLTIPTDPGGGVFIPYRGEERSYQYLSATDIIHGQFDPTLVEDALILVGTSAAGLFDLRATPVDKVFPGVEVHANLISAMLDERFPRQTAWAKGLDYVIILGVGLLFALIFPHLRPIALISVWLATSSAFVLGNFWLWQEKLLVTSLALPLIVLLFLALLNMTWGYLRETRGRARLSSMFGQYVPPALVEEMNRNPDGHFGFEGESRDMTVLFCDIRDFTTLSEALPANELKKLLNFFFTPMTQIIFENRGTVDKYVGDMIMAFWGAPLKDEDHRAHGVLTALRMLDQLRTMKPEFEARGWPVLHMGVGVNSGMMNVGDMGSTYRRAYTVLGDTVNMASRFEGLTKFYSVRLIVGEETQRELAERFLFRLLDRVRVKGALRGVTVYEPICLIEEASETLREAIAEHQQGMEHYFARRWDEAEAIFHRLKEPFEDEGFYDLIQGRIDTLRQNPPAADWDGIYIHTTK